MKGRVEKNHCGQSDIDQNVQTCDGWDNDCHNPLAQTSINNFPKPLFPEIFRGWLFQDPENFDHEDDERREKAEQQPVVEHFQVSSFSHGSADALVHGVHDQHDSQGQPGRDH